MPVTYPNNEYEFLLKLCGKNIYLVVVKNVSANQFDCFQRLTTVNQASMYQ